MPIDEKIEYLQKRQTLSIHYCLVFYHIITQKMGVEKLQKRGNYDIIAVALRCIYRDKEKII